MVHASGRGRSAPAAQYRELRSDLLLVKRPAKVRGCSSATCSKWIASRSAIATSASTSCSSAPSPDAAQAGRGHPGGKLALQHRPDHADHQHADPGAGVLRPRQPGRFSSSRARPATSSASPAWPTTAAIWMIEYRETRKGTMVRGANDRDIPSHGRIWIDSATGRIPAHRVDQRRHRDPRADRRHLPGRSRPAICWCRPKCANSTNCAARSRASTAARTYSRFRQFTVTTTEKPKS